MCYYIGIEDLAANALIAILKKNQSRFVTYSEVEKYGNAVVKILNEKGEKAVLILSRERTNNMFNDYSEFYEESEQNGENGIKLRDGKELKDLICQFRGYLSLDVLRAFISSDSLKVLGV